jgi:hypothetical protein
MSKFKVQTKNMTNLKIKFPSAQAPKTVNLGFEIKGIDLTFEL